MPLFFNSKEYVNEVIFYLVQLNFFFFFVCKHFPISQPGVQGATLSCCVSALNMSSRLHCCHVAPIFYLFLSSAFVLVSSLPISSLNSSQPGRLPSGNIATTLLPVHLTINYLWVNPDTTIAHLFALVAQFVLCFQTWIRWPPCPLEELNWNQVAFFFFPKGVTPTRVGHTEGHPLCGTKLSEVPLLRLNITGFKHPFNESINGLLEF